MHRARRLTPRQPLWRNSRQGHSLRVWAPARLLALVSVLLVGWSGIVLADTLSVANNGIDTATCGSSGAPCRSISQAIAHASEGDTIEVGPGRYGDLNGNRILGEVGEEAAEGVLGCFCMIKINKRLTLVSSDGAAVTVLDVGGIDIIGVRIEADGVVFGARGQGFTIANAGSHGLVVDASTSDVTVVGNIAMHNGLDLNNGFTIQGSGHTIRENIALGNTLRAGFYILGSGHTVSDNVASGNRFGFELSFSGQFTQNAACSNGDGPGIIINNAAIIEIFRNAVIGNEGDGIQVLSQNATITENNIFGNGTLGSNCGLLNESGTVLMAPNNFWGAASGPGPDPADAVGAACGGNPAPTIVDPIATKPFNIPVQAGQCQPLDQTPPAITIAASPTTLWPPNGQLVTVTVSGTITDEPGGLGVNLGSAAYVVMDEYGQVQPRGGLAVEADGRYTFTVALEASRRGNDQDGRHYTIAVSAKDNAGNLGVASTIVTVPHDQGQGAASRGSADGG
jgi:parallel beta-helix repeat protein